jgi:glycosyltransferase involved in cell wall biosynthesis
MHILLIHQAFASLNEAGGTRHIEMARLLAKKGHRVTIITSPISYLTGKKTTQEGNSSSPEIPFPGVTILRTYTYPALHRSFFHRIISFISFMVSSFIGGLRVRKVDLVWGTSPPIFQAFTAFLLSKIKRVPFLFEVRDLWPDFAIAVGVLHNSTLIRLSFWLEGFLYRHADQVIVNSPGFIQHVTQRGAKIVELIPNGTDLDLFNSQENGAGFREKYHLEEKFIVVYAGAHGISNDLEIVLQAVDLLKATPEIVFVLVGDGKEKTNLQKLALEMQLTNLVFLSPVAKIEMASILAGCDACLAILKPLEMYKTTYPNKVFDYMACARPVVLAIDGVIRKVVEDAHAGIPVAPGNPQELANAVQYLFLHRQDAANMGKSGRKYVEQYFDRKILTDQFAILIESMQKAYG